MKNSHAKPAKPTDISVGLKPHVLREAAITASSGSRKKPKWPRVSGEAFFNVTHFSLTRNALSMTLPIPPSINRQYATVNGRRVLSATGRRYKGTIGQLLMPAASSAEWHAFVRAAGEHYLTLTIHFYFPTLLRRDLDGGLKIAQDALCEAMGLNDNRIMEIHLYKALDRDNPRLECTLALASLSGPGIHKTPARRSTRSFAKPLRKTQSRSRSR